MGNGKGQARPWAAGRDAVDQASSPRPSRLQAQGRRAPFKLGRGGTLGPELGRSGHYAQEGDWTARNLTARMSPWETDHCAAPVSLLPHCTYPNLPPTASPSCRRANGAVCARKPQKRGRLPGATPEQNGTTLGPPNCTLDRPRRTKTRKICSGSQEVNFRWNYSYSNKARATSSEVLDFTLVVQWCILGFVVFFYDDSSWLGGTEKDILSYLNDSHL